MSPSAAQLVSIHISELGLEDVRCLGYPALALADEVGVVMLRAVPPDEGGQTQS